jgi:gluconate 5-dehydrogenase/2-deoxy-D-gluconate 3-dehydrogenase
MAIALRLARTHAPVHLLSLDAETQRAKTEAAFAERGLANPEFIEADVTDRDHLVEIAAGFTRDGVDIGTVVASAGIAVRALALETEDEKVRAMLDTNLYGLFVTFQTMAPIVLAGPDGRFIAISSMSAIHGQKLRAVYAATKGGVSALVRGLAAEWSQDGATVNAIGPGILRTPLTAPYMDQFPERAEAALDHSLVGHLGTVDDVAYTAEYLASPECGYMTGQTIILDGGQTAGSTWW